LKRVRAAGGALGQVEVSSSAEKLQYSDFTGQQIPARLARETRALLLTRRLLASCGLPGDRPAQLSPSSTISVLRWLARKVQPSADSCAKVTLPVTNRNGYQPTVDAVAK